MDEGCPWRQTERDALKKSFLAFGLGRWDKVGFGRDPCFRH